MKFARFASPFVISIALCIVAIAQDLPLAHHVSGNVPVNASPSQRELSAERPLMTPASASEPLQVPPAHNWQLQASLPGSVIHDIYFASATVGYAAAEAGQIWKTTNGGTSWSEVLNLGYPYYFYGVDALTADDVVISGIYDSSTFEGLIRWSHDGGQSWSDDIVLSPTDFTQRVRFPKKKDGLIVDSGWKR